MPPRKRPAALRRPAASKVARKPAIVDDVMLASDSEVENVQERKTLAVLSAFSLIFWCVSGQ